MIEPGAPQKVQVSRTLANEITLQWEPPAQSKGSLTYEVYQVSMRRIHSIIIWQGSLEVNRSILIGFSLVRIIPNRLFLWNWS